MTDWNTIAKDASIVVNALAPLAGLLIPGSTPAIEMGVKIFEAAEAGVPTAIALVKQITSGTPATPAQIAQFEADYESAYQKTKRDIAAARAALPPVPAG